MFKTRLDNTEREQRKKKIEDEEFEKELDDIIEGIREKRKVSIADKQGFDFIIQTKKKVQAINKIHLRNCRFSFGNILNSQSENEIEKVDISNSQKENEIKKVVQKDSASLID